MIQVISDGRLGNQMFHYAFAVATAQQLGTTFQLHFVHQQDEVTGLFNLSKVVQPYRATPWQSRWYQLRKRIGCTAQLDEQPDVFYPALRNHCCYSGFFQNEHYFVHQAALIKQLFQLQPHWKKAFDNIQQDYDFKNSIVIHVRLGDYVHWGNPALGGTDMSLPASYYRHALSRLHATVDSPVILISDDESAAMQRLSFLQNVVIFRHNAELSFQAMLAARRLIISNSTFAWWAAWLNPHQPQVMAPQHWLGFKIGKEHPHGILPASFTPVPVY